MSLPPRSLAVVGADYPNRKGPGRRFEIEVCKPGEPIDLVLEPKNPADPHAIAVFSSRAVQIGYLTAERCGFIGKLIREGREVRAVFQAKTSYGAMIRAAFNGEDPILPEDEGDTVATVSTPADDESGFYPDPIYPDD